jgi:hypothetical protein
LLCGELPFDYKKWASADSGVTMPDSERVEIVLVGWRRGDEYEAAIAYQRAADRNPDGESSQSLRVRAQPRTIEETTPAP